MSKAAPPGVDLSFIKIPHLKGLSNLNEPVTARWL